MAEFVGADSDALNNLATQMNSAATALNRMQHSITGAMNRANWQGRDAAAFQNEWTHTHIAVLASAADMLKAQAADLRRQSGEQRSASAAGSGALGSTAAAVPTLGPSAMVVTPLALLVEKALRLLGWGKEVPPTGRDLEDPRQVGGPGEPRLQKRDFSGFKLFDGGKDASDYENAIRPADVSQGAIGDCYLIAALGALAATPEGRRHIRDMIHDNGDRTYTVTFRDGKKVTVDDDFYTKGNSLAYAKSGELWPLILEEAYAKREGSYGAIVGGSGGDVFKDFGLQSETKSTSSYGDRLDEVLSSGKPITLAAALGPGEDLQFHKAARHEFTVIDYIHFDDPSDQAQDSSKCWAEDYVLIRNPWGDNEGLKGPPGITMEPNGTFRVPVSQVPQMFDQMSVGSW